MTDMKCPFCNRNLHKGEDGIYSHLDYMTECKGRLFDGSKELWQELIRTKELLEIEDAEHSMCHTQMLKTTEKLERTRKALDVAKDKLDTVRQYHRGTAVIRPDDIAAYCDRAIEQITALEQKD